MIKISERLLSLTKYIYNEDKIMDVGCDHAQIDIYLIENGMKNKIYVCDVNPKALQNGISNIEKYKMTDKIIPILGFGIEKAYTFDIDTLIISGMGSNNIIEILSSPNLDKIYKLILQSNTNQNELRKFLINKNYEIADEEIIEDGKKTYINIVAIKSQSTKNYTDIEYEFGPILIKDKKNLKYFENLKENYENIFYASRNDELREKIRALEEIIANLANN